MVTPIHKSGAKYHLRNYRPMTQLCVFSKFIYLFLVTDKIVNYFSFFNIKVGLVLSYKGSFVLYRSCIVFNQTTSNINYGHIYKLTTLCEIRDSRQLPKLAE